MKMCEMTKNCSWQGGPMNGECVSVDPAECEGLGQMECMQNPICRWDNQMMACGGG
jgi:hypothetical protein